MRATGLILRKAMKQGYAVPHFNVSNLETIQAVFNVCEKHKAPALMATSESSIKYASMETLVDLYERYADVGKSKYVLHLDHGKDMKTIKKATKMGYTSVMIDASHEKFSKNVQLTKKVVKWAGHHVSVEAEIGTIGGQEDYVKGKIKYTDPEQAKEFVEKTGCDSLAIAIGTSHGAYKFPGKSKLNMEILKEVRKKVTIPLVLHGASHVSPYWVKKANKYGAKLGKAHGVGDKDIKQAIKFGIDKINIDTDLRIAFDASMRQFLSKNKGSINYRKMLSSTRIAMEKVMEEKITLFGCRGKA